MTRKRGSHEDKNIIQEIKLDPRGKYLLVVKGLSKEQLTLLRMQLGQFFSTGSMPFFILAAGEDQYIRIVNVREYEEE